MCYNIVVIKCRRREIIAIVAIVYTVATVAVIPEVFIFKYASCCLCCNSICRRRREFVANVAVLPEAYPIKDSNYGS